jgi:hypothetical protein
VTPRAEAYTLPATPTLSTLFERLKANPRFVEVNASGKAFVIVGAQKQSSPPDADLVDSGTADRSS